MTITRRKSGRLRTARKAPDSARVFGQKIPVTRKKVGQKIRLFPNISIVELRGFVEEIITRIGKGNDAVELNRLKSENFRLRREFKAHELGYLEMRRLLEVILPMLPPDWEKMLPREFHSPKSALNKLQESSVKGRALQGGSAGL